ncbi:MAG: BTAD domain-containing putative transcriptional regulator [Patescibacteria group bacterium]
MSASGRLIPAKLSPPAVGDGLFPRPRLLELFAGYERRPATLLSAPAGYGKTVAMAQFRETLAGPSLWYQLDHYDNDPVVFLQYLLRGMQGIFPDLGREAALLLKHERNIALHLRRVMAAMIERLTGRTGPGVVVFLDDYHLVSDDTIRSFIDEFIAYLPARNHLVIAGRPADHHVSPRLGLGGRIKVLGADELRFSPDEARSIGAVIAPSITAQAIEAWEKQTAGWPMALHLLRAMEARAPGGRPITYMRDYLAAEVLEGQPKQVRDFLRRTSVLGVLTPPLCNRLLSRTDAEKILKHLLKCQLFITRLDGPGQAYRYHQLFREFLLEELGDKRQGLLLKAGRASLQAGDPDQAVEYLIEAQAFQEAARIIVEAGRNALRLGRWRTVARWLEVLPREEMEANPWLMLHRAEVAVCRGKLDEGELWIDRALQAFVAKQDQNGMAECLAKKGRVLRSRGRYQESMKLLEQAIPCLLQEELTKRYDLPLEQAMNLLFSGQLAEAETILRTALAKAESQCDAFIIAHLSMALSNLYFVRGELGKATEMCRRSTNIAAEPIMTNYFLCDDTALILMEWGEIDQALAHARRGIAVLEEAGLNEILPSAYLQLAYVQMEVGDTASAAEGFRRAADLSGQSGGDRSFGLLSQVCLARCLIALGKPAEARPLLTKTLAEARLISPLVLAMCQSLATQALAEGGDADAALQLGTEAVAVLEGFGARYTLPRCYATLAAIHAVRGEAVQAALYAEKCLRLAASGNYLQMFIGSFALFQFVLRHGLELDRETDFVQRTLARIGPAALVLLRELARHPEPAVRERVIMPLAWSGGAAAERTLQALADDSDAKVREAARQALARLHPAGQAADRPPLRLEMLGPLRVFADGAEITAINWRMKKTRDLLVYLAHAEAPVAKERILEHLWPGLDAEKASEVFHTALYALRQILGRFCRARGAVEYGGGRYRLAPSAFSTDRQAFAALRREALAGDPPAPGAVAALEAMAALYRGDYLEDLDYDWYLPERVRLQQEHLEIRGRLARYYLREREFGRAIAHLVVLAQQNPFSEEIVGQLLTAQAGAGNLAACRETYRRFAKLLRDELGLEPSPELQSLHRGALAGG